MSPRSEHQKVGFPCSLKGKTGGKFALGYILRFLLRNSSHFFFLFLFFSFLKKLLLKHNGQMKECMHRILLGEIS